MFFWKVLDNSFIKQSFQTEFYTKIDNLDILRVKAHMIQALLINNDLVTFSELYFLPKIIVEIGSFIGKSTFSIALATDCYLPDGNCNIFCCDYQMK